MSSLLGGSPKSTSTTTATLPSWIQGPIKDLVGRTTDLMDKPYQAYEGQRIADFNGDETQAFDMIRQLMGQTDPQLQYSQGISQEVANRGLNGFSQQTLNRYMNPYQENVLDVAKRRSLDTFDGAKQRLMDQKANIGAFGGSRTGLSEQSLYGNFSRDLADRETMGLAANYSQAQNAAFAGTQMAGQAGMDYANLANSRLQSGLTEAGALGQAGSQQRSLEQAGLDVNYQDFLTEQAYPYEQLQFGANLLYPAGNLMRGQTTTQQTSGGDSGILGAAIGLGSMAMGIPGIGAAIGGGMAGMGGMGSLASSLGGSIFQGYGSAIGNQAVGKLTQAGLFADGGAVNSYIPKAQNIGGNIQPMQPPQQQSNGGQASGGSGGGLGDVAKIAMMFLADGGNVSYIPDDVSDYLRQITPLAEASGLAMPNDLGSPEGQKSMQILKQMLEIQGDPDTMQAVGNQMTSPEQGTRAQMEAAMSAGNSSMQTLDPQASSRAAPMPTGGLSGHKYQKEIEDAATKYGVNPMLIANMMRQESAGKANAKSGKGASGLMQLMPATAKELGVTDIFDPVQNINGGTKYMKQMLDKYNGNVDLALAAYNAGPGAVDKYGGIPPYKETQNYVKKINGYASGGAVEGDELMSAWYKQMIALGKNPIDYIQSYNDDPTTKELMDSWGAEAGKMAAPVGDFIDRQGQSQQALLAATKAGAAEGWDKAGTGIGNAMMGLEGANRFVDRVKQMGYHQPNPGDTILDRGLKGIANVPIAATKGLLSPVTAGKKLAGGEYEWQKGIYFDPRFTDKEAMTMGVEKFADTPEKMKALQAVQNKLMAQAMAKQTQSPTEAAAPAQAAKVMQGIVQGNTQSGYDPSLAGFPNPLRKEESSANKDSMALFNFGAALLGGTEGFGKSFGQAAKVYATTKQEEQAMEYAKQKQMFDQQMQQLKTQLYGQQVQAQMAKVNNPYTKMKEQMNLQLLQQRLEGGNIQKRIDTFAQAMMKNSGTTDPAEIEAIMAQARKMAMTSAVAENLKGTGLPDDEDITALSPDDLFNYQAQ